MSFQLPAEYDVEHYPKAREPVANGSIHALGIAAATVAGATLIRMAAAVDRPGLIAGSYTPFTTQALQGG